MLFSNLFGLLTKIATISATYGYARQYSGVNLGTYIKHITSSELTEDGLKNVGGAVMELAKVEELEAHRRAVEIRLDWIKSQTAA